MILHPNIIEVALWYHVQWCTVELRSKWPGRKGIPPIREIILGYISFFPIHFYIGYKGIWVYKKNWTGPVKSFGAKFHCISYYSRFLYAARWRSLIVPASRSSCIVAAVIGGNWASPWPRSVRRLPCLLRIPCFLLARSRPGQAPDHWLFADYLFSFMFFFSPFSNLITWFFIYLFCF